MTQLRMSMILLHHKISVCDGIFSPGVESILQSAFMKVSHCKEI